jgi:acetyltransferase-like isoleucine patch superfamily enzyme
VGWGTWMAYPQNIRIGEHVSIGRNAFFTSESPTASLSIGDAVSINEDVRVDFSGGIVVQKMAFISEGAIIYSHTHGLNPRDPPTWMQKEIGADAWIGARSIVMHGCTYIGPRSVIGAGSIVTKPIADGSIAVGQGIRTLQSDIALGGKEVRY